MFNHRQNDESLLGLAILLKIHFFSWQNALGVFPVGAVFGALELPSSIVSALLC